MPKRKSKTRIYIILIALIITVCIVIRYWEQIVGFIIVVSCIYYGFRSDKKQHAQCYYEHITQDIANTDQMTGIEFEQYLSYLFEKKGYHVNMTSVTNDYGADLILKKNGETIVVQAKRHKDNIGVSAVQEVNAAISYYNANKAMVVTNSYFTPNAKSLAFANHIQLIDRDKLSKLIHEII